MQYAPVTDNEIASHSRVCWFRVPVVSCDNALPCAGHVRRLLLLLLVGRPGDVLQTRSGITVENGNTDAEVGLSARAPCLHASPDPTAPPRVTPDRSNVDNRRLVGHVSATVLAQRHTLQRAIRSFAV